MAFGLLWLVWILYTTLQLGIGGLSVDLFTQSTPPPNTDGGGLANAIVGSLMLVVLATFVGTPLGILAGVYLAEYGQKRWLASVTRFINDILLSAPSIVVGLFVYALVVAKMGRFCGWAGVIALALLQIPIVIRTTENMLKLVPNALREAAFALGTPKWKMVMSITLKASVARHRDRRAARRRAYCRRNRAAAFHGAVEPVLLGGHEPAGREPAGHDLQVRDESVPAMAIARVGRRVPDHARRAGTEYPRARDLFEEVRAECIPMNMARKLNSNPTARPHGAQPARCRAAAARRTAPSRAEDRGQQPELLLRQVPRAEEHQPAHSRRQGDRVHRPVGLRQVHAAAHASTRCTRSIRSSAPKARS